MKKVGLTGKNGEERGSDRKTAGKRERGGERVVRQGHGIGIGRDSGQIGKGREREKDKEEDR